MNLKNSKIDKLCFFKNPSSEKDKIEIFKFNKSKKIMTIILKK